MEFVSKQTIESRKKHWNKVAYTFTAATEPLLIILMFAAIILAFSPLHIDEQPTSNYTKRVGLWISYGGPNSFSFGGLNLGGIIAFAIALVCYILIYYFNFFKAEQTAINKYAYYANGIMLISTLLSFLVGELATLDNGKTFLIYSSNSTESIFSINSIGYILLVFNVVFLVSGIGFWGLWLQWFLKIRSYAKIHNQTIAKTNQTKK